LKRLKPFAYFEPTTLGEAVEILSQKGTEAYPLAGGTDLLVRMKKGEIKPSVLVNLKRIDGLARIEEEPGKGLRVGALASIAAVENSSLVGSSHPLLAEAAGLLGSPAIRNLATLGGNIGRASPAADMAPALIVLQALVSVEGRKGKRELDVEHLITGPGITSLTAGEVITSFFLPKITPSSGAAYLKLGRREGMDCALVGVAAFLSLGDKNTEATEAKIALAAVAPVPQRAKKAEEILLAGPLTEERIQEAAEAAAGGSLPISDMRASGSYRQEMVRVLTLRALRLALHRAQGGKS
jgi:carbon-monoxide dehydrogenase medium subunit